VSTQRGAGLNYSAAAVRPSLERLVQNLERDAVRSKRLIRQFADEDGPGFLREALQVLQTNTESHGVHHVLSVLVADGLLVPALADPQLSREKALALAQEAARIDPAIDVALARNLAESAGSPDAASEVERHARLMEILESISDGARIFPSLVRLLRHPSAHIRSKAVLMIGRGNRSPKWLRTRLSDTDSRIRANAAEALWDVRTEDARELLLSLIHDSNNRVAGNAILGLYRLGEQAMIPEILGMVRHDSPLFRATAAWIMGASRDPRFTEIAAGLLRDGNAVVRKRAFAAVGHIRAAVAQAAQGRRWRLTARLLEPEPGKPVRRLLIGVAGENGAAGEALLPTQFSVFEDGDPVIRYRVVERPAPETVSVVFILPRAGGARAAGCLPWKRPSDLWACLYYSPAAPGTREVDTVPRFQSSPDAISTELDRSSTEIECPDVWRTLGRAVDPELRGFSGKRNVILFTDATNRIPAPSELRSMVAAGQAFVQVVSTGPDPEVEDFCRQVNGVFRLASPEAAVDAYLSLFSRYELSYQPGNAEPRSLKIRVFGPEIYAETELIPNPSPAGP
jgi:HEAT repeat protein